MVFEYQPQGVCSRLMRIEVEDGTVKSLQVVGGCSGNLQGISKLVEGMKVEEVVARLEQSQWLVLLQKLQNLFDKLWVKLLLLALVLVVLFIALRNAIFGPPSRSRRNRRRRSNNVYSTTYRGRR